MVKNKSGHIVTVSSLAGKVGPGLRSSYGGAKHAVAGFFDSVRAEVIIKLLFLIVFYKSTKIIL